MNPEEIIKSVRIYEENNLIKTDFRVKPTAKLPIGKMSNRFRFSHGVTFSPKEFKRIELNKFKMAHEHYLSLFDNVENKEVVLFEDVAYDALAEAEVNRRKTDGTKNYLSILENRVLPYFGKMPIKSILPKDIRSFILEMSKLGMSRSTWFKHYFVIKRVFDYIAENFTDSSPLKHVKRSSPLFKIPSSQEDAYYTRDEVDKMLKATYNGRNEYELRKHNFISLFCHVGLLQGLRTGEIMALKYSDLDFENSTINVQRSITRSIIDVPKNGESRLIPLVDKLRVKLLKSQEIAKCDWVFPNPQTLNPYTYSRTISDHHFKPFLSRLDIPYKKLYQLRASFSTLALLSGVSLPVVSKCLGHKSLAVTEKHYIKLNALKQTDMKNELELLTA